MKHESIIFSAATAIPPVHHVPARGLSPTRQLARGVHSIVASSHMQTSNSDKTEPVFNERHGESMACCTNHRECGQLQDVLSEIAALQRALAFSQQQLTAALQTIAGLKRSEAGLKRQLQTTTDNYTQALHFAHHDELTGLPNRCLFQDRLNQSMAQADRQRKPVALLFIDLDEFKTVNDELGHNVGDLLLREVAWRLSASIRGGDTACRYGGDEFLILLTDIDSECGVAASIDKIRARLAEPYCLDGQTVSITASIGAAVYRQDGQSCVDLLKKADSAMYRAKGRRS